MGLLEPLRLEITANNYNLQPSDDVHQLNSHEEVELDAWSSENRSGGSISCKEQQESNNSNTRQGDNATFRLEKLYLDQDFNLQTTLPLVRRCRGLKRFRIPCITSEPVLLELARLIPTYWPDLELLDLRNFEVHMPTIDYRWPEFFRLMCAITQEPVG